MIAYCREYDLDQTLLNLESEIDRLSQEIQSKDLELQKLRNHIAENEECYMKFRELVFIRSRRAKLFMDLFLESLKGLK